ncbi:GTPase IMAP family member 7-like [Alosa alosa]|uniref:GTPase IMAP family member 7-like n=1 Tax=Alosa alosa TaxID=278164 RepID=UPI0020151B3F|nr:GTPase IMAP family member 7-like [Alosa alosa]
MASSSGSAAFRLVLLGLPGAGKTTAANAILGRDVFPECATTNSSMQTQIIGGRSISLIDTPSFLMGSSPSDGGRPSGEDLEQCMCAAAPGPHAFLLVVPLGRPLSAEVTGAVEWIGQRLGEDALRMTVVLFTRRERVTRREWDSFLSRQEVRDLIRRCGGGCHAVNSKAEIEACQVTELLEKVRAMAEKRGGGHYATDKFLAAQKKAEAEREDASAVVGKEERKWGDMRKEMEMKRQMRQDAKRREEEDKKRREEERRKKEQLELQERERRRKQRLEVERERQEEVARRLEVERERQEEETQRLVLERRRREMERPSKEESQQVARGGRQQQQDAWWMAERCAAVAGSFMAPFFRR